MDSTLTPALSPDFDHCYVGVSPSVVCPWGWHDPDGQMVCVNYNAHRRTVAYGLVGRHQCMDPDAESGGAPWRQEVWARLGVEKWTVGARRILDDWSAGEGADEWLAVRAATGVCPDEQRVLAELSADPHPAAFGSALRGGVVVAKKWVGGWSHLPIPAEVTRTLSEHSLVVTRAVELLGSNTFTWDERGAFSAKDKLLLADVVADLIVALRKGDLDRAAKCGDVYWTWAAGVVGMPAPDKCDYMKARLAGAWGFPLDGDATTLFLFAPPDRRARVLTALDGWRELNLKVTPYGARLAGVC